MEEQVDPFGQPRVVRVSPWVATPVVVETREIPKPAQGEPGVKRGRNPNSPDSEEQIHQQRAAQLRQNQPRVVQVVVNENMEEDDEAVVPPPVSVVQPPIPPPVLGNQYAPPPEFWHEWQEWGQQVDRDRVAIWRQLNTVITDCGTLLSNERSARDQANAMGERVAGLEDRIQTLRGEYNLEILRLTNLVTATHGVTSEAGDIQSQRLKAEVESQVANLMGKFQSDWVTEKAGIREGILQTLLEQQRQIQQGQGGSSSNQTTTLEMQLLKEQAVAYLREEAQR